MKILAHRGHWLAPAEKNSFAAFARAWSGGYGVETDLRDRDGEIVISHDPAMREATTFAQLLEAHAAQGPDTPLALNIKADGLQGTLARSLAQYRAPNFFVFDMSIPDTLHYLRAGIPVFVRLSEHEPETALLDSAAGVWLDAFDSEWWTLDMVRALCAREKTVAIVSSELHGRPHQELWRALAGLEQSVRDKLMLCTDFPDDAVTLSR
jgi:glycerophosphoryl diester phosphodiesterase